MGVASIKVISPKVFNPKGLIRKCLNDTNALAKAFAGFKKANLKKAVENLVWILPETSGFLPVVLNKIGATASAFIPFYRGVIEETTD
jgi:hypothetical protein